MKQILTRQKLLLMLFSIFFLPLSLMAQEMTVKGTIVDKEDGMGLPGVTVLNTRTQSGSISDIDGAFTLSALKDDVLVLSFIGYANQRITVLDASPLKIEMESDMVGLDEIVVIGYGVQKKTDRTGAVAQITAEELNSGSLTDPIQSMQGKAAGVMITRKGGDPNSGFSVRVRGAAGFEAGTEPLYVVDGIPGVDATTIAPEDIETFNVLKDAASTAIYGSRGANGVIIITTKQGKAGQGTVNFNAKLTVDQIAKKVDMLSADELRDFANKNSLTLIDNGANTDWQDEIYRTGFSQNYNVNFSGGNETSNYYASLTHSDWEGILRGTSKERTIGKLNVQHKAIDNRLTLSGSLGATFEQNDYENYGGYNKDDIIYQAISRNPTDPVYNADGSYFGMDRGFNYENPLSVIDNIDNIRDAKRLLGSFKTDFEFFKGFVGSVNLGYMRNDHENSYFRPKGTVYNTADIGAASKSYANDSEKVLEAILSYNELFSNVHSLSAVAGYSWQEKIYNGFNAGGTNPNSSYVKYNNLGTLLSITRNDVGSYKGMSRLIGFFGRVQYNYDSKYFVSASIRRDGSTKFGENNKWGWFPTAAVGWTLTREPFLDNIYWLDNLKVRASYGISGNQNIGEYNGQMYYEPAGMGVNPETGANTIIYTAAKNANPDLKWEQTAETNIGLDFALFRSRVSGSFEYYIKNTTDLLGAYSVPVPPNPADRIWANSGELKNTGFEANVQWYALDYTNFKWKTSVTFSTNKQEVISLGEYASADGVRKEGYLIGRGLIGANNYVSAVIEGESIGIFYLPEYVGLSGDGKFIYTTEAGGYTDEVSAAKRVVAGNATPIAEIGWSNSLTFYKNWSLDFSLRSLVGHDMFNATKMFFDYPGLLPNLNAMPEALDWHAQGRTSGPAVSDIYVEDASFLRLDYVSLGYKFNLRNDKIFKDLKMNISGNNLFTLTNYSGVDPETSLDGLAYGIDQYNVYPKARSYTFGISATF